MPLRVLRHIGACLLAFHVAAPAQSLPKIVLAGGPQALLPEIAARYEQRYPQFPADWIMDGASGPLAADLVFSYYPTPSELAAVKTIAAARHLAFPVEFATPVLKQPVDPQASAQAAAYFDEGGLENGVRLFAFLYQQVRPNSLTLEPPVPGLSAGIYHPDAPTQFRSFEEYRAWWMPRHPGAEPARQAIAIHFFSSWLRGRDLAVVDALVRRAEAANLMPIAAFGYPAETVTPLLRSAGVAISLSGTLSAAKDADVYSKWGLPVLNGLVSRESAAEWEANPKGLPAERMAAHLSFPERNGMVAPLLLGTTEVNSSGIKTSQPFEPGVQAATDRAQRTLALRAKPNAEKRVALVYYNNPPGRGNIGASYLQVFPSLRNILTALRADGYAATGSALDENSLRALLEENGRNLEGWSLGQVGRSATSAVLWPVADYRRHYNRLPATLRLQVEATWGKPEAGGLMTTACGTQKCFLLPMLWLGNVLVAPQPLRTTSAQASDPAHDRVTPPPHQYLAFYLWLQSEWQADALVHLGRHGTVEWLPGKQTALHPADAPAAVLGSLPNFNVYVMDGGGEAIQAKRRAHATLISHLTPMIWRAGGRNDLEKLHQAFHELTGQDGVLSPALAREYEQVVRAETLRLGLDRQLQLDMQSSLAVLSPPLHRFLHQVEDAPVPAGLPVFGETPSEDRIRQAISASLFASFPAALHAGVEPHIPCWAEALLSGVTPQPGPVAPEVSRILLQAAGQLPRWIHSLRESGPVELQGLLDALRGQHLPSRLLGDPLRKPEALPTGGNLHAIDASRIPTEAAWRVGQQMAKEFLQRYEQTHAKPARRVSLVLWYGETERHQGAMESMALSLLGVRPVWNQRGIVEELQLIPAQELGRPRIDVVFTVSGNYRDGFPEKLQLLDRAVRLAGTAEHGEIARHDREIAASLRGQGTSAEDARKLGELRIFSAKPGAYGVGVQYLVEKSGGGDSLSRISGLYAANMGFGYSRETWGIASTPALLAHLRTVDAVHFSRSSNLYAALDNDDTYQYVGGLRTAVQAASGRVPEVMLHNLRNGEAGKLSTLREWLAVELGSRQFNPAWIKAMRESGYAGARQMSRELEHLYGFQKTAPDHVSSQNWQTALEVYVHDRYQLGLQTFFQQQNPHALQALLARLIDVDRQGIHRFSATDRRTLLLAYSQSVINNGPMCSALDCGSPVLRSHVSRSLQQNGLAGQAAQLRRAYAQSLPPTPRPAAQPALHKPANAASQQYRLADLKILGKYLITWVHPARLSVALKALPLWLCALLLILYAGTTAIRLLSARAFNHVTPSIFRQEASLARTGVVSQTDSRSRELGSGS